MDNNRVRVAFFLGLIALAIPNPPKCNLFPPGSVIATSSSSQVNLSWIDTNSCETGCEVWRSADGVTFALLTTVGANVVNYQDLNLQSATPYYYKVRAVFRKGPTSTNGPFSNIARIVTSTTPVTPSTPTPTPTPTPIPPSPSPTVVPAQWTWTPAVPPPMHNDWGGGASARVDAIAVDPTNANVVYEGSAGGLAKSVDDGSTWQYLSDKWASQAVSAIAIDPASLNVYVGTGSNPIYGVGIYRSIDGGLTWSLFGAQFAGKGVMKIVVDPRVVTTLYASVSDTTGTNALWKSTDSGATWSMKRSSTGGPWWGPGFYDVVLDASTNPSTIYYSATDGVFRSVDGASSWTLIRSQPGLLDPCHLAFVNHTLFVSYLHYTDHPETHFAKSADNGTTWIDIAGSVYGSPYVFGVDPQNGDHLFSGWAELYFSIDGGLTWGKITGEPGAPAVHADIHSIAFAASDASTVYLGTDGGIYRSTAAGIGSASTWLNLNQNLSGSLMEWISLSKDSSLVMACQDNGTQLYRGDGKPWLPIYGGDGGASPHIDPNNSALIYFQYIVGTVTNESYAPMKILNNVWNNVTPVGAYGETATIFPAMFVNRSNPNEVLMGFNNIWRTLDGGISWQQIGGATSALARAKTRVNPYADGNPMAWRNLKDKHWRGQSGARVRFMAIQTGATVSLIAEAPSNTNVVYARAGSLFVTTNANAGLAATWTNISPGLPDSCIDAIAIDPTNPDKVYVAMCGAGIYKSTNRGTSWSPVIGLSPTLHVNDLIFDLINPNTLIAGTVNGVWYSKDGDATWRNVSTSGIPAGMTINSLSMNSETRQLVAATVGRGAYTTFVPQ